MRYKKWRVFICFLESILLASGLAACTFAKIKPEINIAPTKAYTILAVGDISTNDKLREHLVPHFRKALVQRLIMKKAFPTVLESPPETLGDSAVLFSGRLTQVNKGNAALRWLVGFGAGRASVNGVFQIQDSEDRKLAEFAGSEIYAGGLGIGGPGFSTLKT